MKVLVIRCGRSTLKFQGPALDEATSSGGEKRLDRGIVERISRRGIAKCFGGDVLRKPRPVGGELHKKESSLEETTRAIDHGRATQGAFD